MIVDDDPRILVELEELLNDQYNIITVSSGKEALNFIQSMKNPEKISLLISDQRMPGMSGTQLFERIIDQGYIPDAIRIILTGYFEISVIVEAINKADIHQYILKPFEIDNKEFFLQIQMAIQKFEKQKSLKKAFRSTVFFEQMLANDICQIECEYNNWLEKKTNPLKSCLTVIMLNLDELNNMSSIRERKLTEKILEQLSSLLLERCRKSDLAVRWKDSQLMILGRFKSRKEAPKIANQIHEEILQKKRDLENKEKISLQFSIGFSIYPPFPQKTLEIPWNNVVSIANEAIKIAGPDSWAGLVPSTKATPDDLLNPHLNIRELIDNKILLVHPQKIDLKKMRHEV